MPVVDSKVASIIDRPSYSTNDDEQDEDALIEELENDDSLDAFRERRAQQLHEEFAKAKSFRSMGHGTLEEVMEEKAAMDITTSTTRCIIHFFKADFVRCRIMDDHLKKLASIHAETKFIRINVENAPFLVTKLQIQVLPCVLAFINGVAADRVIGFEGIGKGTDKFTTAQLEARLLQSTSLERVKITDGSDTKARSRAEERPEQSDSDDDFFD